MSLQQFTTNYFKIKADWIEGTITRKEYANLATDNLKAYLTK